MLISGGFMNSANFNVGGRADTLNGLLNINGIQPFLDNPSFTEVAINRPFELWTESSKGWQKHEMPNLAFSTLKQIANTFANFNKLEINMSNPICSGVMPNGQRGQVVIPSACERDTVSIVVRRPSDTRFSLSSYIDSGRLDTWIDTSTFQTKNLILPSHLESKRQKEEAEISYLNDYLGIPEDVHLQLFELKMLKAKADRDIDTFVRLAVEHKQNICLIGATGSGKTTFTKAVCDLVPVETRIITIEDTAELDLPNHANRVHLFYKDVSPKDLLKSCMRMKPDRIFLTELRGEEAFDYLMALNTGHGGSITTVHANDCNSAYYRVGSLIKQSDIGQKLDFEYIMSEVYTTLDVMMFLSHTYVKEIAYDPIRKYRLLKGKKA